MGFTEGIMTGTSMVKTASDIAINKATESRQERQSKLTEESLRFTNEQNSIKGKLTAPMVDLELENLKLQNETLKKSNESFTAQNNSKGITDILSAWTSGNVGEAMHLWDTNLVLKESLKGTSTLNVAGLSPINFNDPRDINKVKELGLDPKVTSTPEGQDALNKSLIKIRGLDGTDRIVKVDDLIKQTNTINMMSGSQKDTYIKQSRLVNSILKGSGYTSSEEAGMDATKQVASTVAMAQSNQLSNLGPNATSEQIAAVTNPLLPKDKLAAENNIKIEEMRLAAKKSGGANSASEMLAGMKLNQEMFKQTMDTNSVSIVDSIVSKKPDEKFTQNEVNAAKAIQGDKTIDTKVKDMLTVGNTTVNGLIPVYKKIDNANIDWNALSKVKTKMLSLGGDDFANFAKLSDTEKENMYKKMGIETELQSVVANYIKLMSGAAVQNEERAMYNNIIMSGNWADKKAALTTLESFTGKQLEQFGTTIDSIAYSNPYDYINQKRLYNKASDDYSKMTGSTVTPSSSTVTPSSSTVTPSSSTVTPTISKEAAIEELKRRGLIK